MAIITSAIIGGGIFVFISNFLLNYLSLGEAKRAKCLIYAIEQVISLGDYPAFSGYTLDVYRVFQQ